MHFIVLKMDAGRYNWENDCFGTATDFWMCLFTKKKEFSFLFLHELFRALLSFVIGSECYLARVTLQYQL